MKINKFLDSQYLILSVILSISVFTANMFLVYFAIKSDPGLVEKNYYYKGIKFNDVLKSRKILKKLAYKVDLNIEGKDQYKQIQFLMKNKDKKNENISIKLHIYRPSQKNYDSFYQLTPDKSFTVKHYFKKPGKWILFYKGFKNNKLIFDNKKTIYI